MGLRPTRFRSAPSLSFRLSASPRFWLSRCEQFRSLGPLPSDLGWSPGLSPSRSPSLRSRLPRRTVLHASSCTLKTEQRRSSYVSKHSAFFLLRSSPRLISTGQLHTLLHFHLRPIDDVVYIEPYLLKSERSYLRVSFTLRCLQRLSRPYVATQLCPWQDNWCTSGTSIPVLSY